MIRDLKILGLTLAAVFAFSAMVASGAMAQEGKFTSANGKPFTLTGTEIEGVNNVFEGPFGVEVRCPGSTYTGHKLATTPHQRLANGATAATISPKYSNCVDEAGDSAVVHMNGCDFVVHHATTVTPPNTFAVTMDVVCPAGKQIVITKKIACDVTIGSQANLTGLHIKNEAGDLRLSGSIKPKATVCSFPTTVTHKLDVTIKADDSEDKAVNVTMSD